MNWPRAMIGRSMRVLLVEDEPHAAQVLAKGLREQTYAVDVAAELQAIIDSAPAGETILMGAGTFEFNETVVINRDDITVMGTGSDQTFSPSRSRYAENTRSPLAMALSFAFQSS